MGQLTILSGHDTTYQFLFADSTYSTANYKTSISDLLGIFDTQLTFSDLTSAIAIKGEYNEISERSEL